jgi:hypothetical protein
VAAVETYEAHLDASGTHDGSKVVVVGGCVSTKDQWERLIPDWNRILSEAGVGPVNGVRRLHMKELTAGTGGFDGWKEPQRRQLLTRGCELRDPTACSAAAKMYELGEGCQKDPERAQQLLSKAGQPGQTTGQVRGFVRPVTPEAE